MAEDSAPPSTAPATPSPGPDGQKPPAAPVAFSQADAHVITQSLTQSGLITSAENQASIENLLKKGMSGQSPKGVLPGEEEGWMQKIGNLWNMVGQPILNKLFDWIKQVFVFISELFSNHFNMGEASKKAQAYGAMRDTGRQMGDSLAFFRDALPFGEQGLNCTINGVTPREYEEIYFARNAQLKAKTPEQREQAEALMASVDQRMQAAHGVTGKEAWENFVAYKKELMDTLASRMGKVAVVNGLKDTPTDGEQMIRYWQHNAASGRLASKASGTPERDETASLPLQEKNAQPLESQPLERQPLERLVERSPLSPRYDVADAGAAPSLSTTGPLVPREPSLQVN